MRKFVLRNIKKEPLKKAIIVLISLLATLGFYFSIIVITNGCNSIIVASNTVFNIENAPFLKRMIKSLFLSIILIILMAFVLIIPLFGKSIINLIGLFTDFVANHRQTINTLYTILQMK